MKVGLVGFAGSGKTTVFNTLTSLHVPTGFGGEVHLGTVKVPDARIDALSKIFKPKKTTYAEIVFSDIPGEHGAESKGLSRKALERIREQDVLCLVLRAFENPAVERAPDPVADLQAFLTECVLADLAVVERRLDRDPQPVPARVAHGHVRVLVPDLASDARRLPAHVRGPGTRGGTGQRDALSGRARGRAVSLCEGDVTGAAVPLTAIAP